MADHSRLGRGLAALIGDVGDETPVADSGRKPRRAPIENLQPNPRNPSRLFTDDELDELAASIRERGIIQPIVVRALQRRQLRDYRRRTAVARSATRRTSRRADCSRRSE